MQRGRDPFALMVPPGEYVIVLEVGNKRLTGKAKIKKRAGWPVGPAGYRYDHPNS